MNYRIISQNSLTVINFEGSITRADRDALMTCMEEMKSLSSSAFILNFKNVSDVEYLLFRELTMLQHEVRRKNVDLVVAGLGMKLKALLLEKGVVRVSELKGSVGEAIQIYAKTSA